MHACRSTLEDPTIITGLSIGLLTGKIQSTYRSQEWFYVYNGDPAVILTAEELFAIINSGDAEAIGFTDQVSTTSDAYSPNVKHSAQTYEVYLGVQGTVYRGVKVFATYRTMYYDHVGERLGINSQGFTTTSRSVGYEGYLLGASWRF